MLTVFIVEDDPETRRYFCECVAGSTDLRLVGEVATVEEARRWLASESLGPDVALIDLGLPDGSGLAVIRQIHQQFPACDVLVISMFGDDDSVLASIEAGAVGYIHKDEAPHDVATTIRQVHAGASPISPMLARSVLRRFRVKPLPPVVSVTDAADMLLSTKEQAVLELIARGFSYAEIARLQVISVHTVQTHIKNLYKKLSVHSRSEAVFEASRMGLLKSFEAP